MDIGIITGTELEENLDSDGNVRMLQIELVEDNVELIELASACGIDYNPPDDAIAFVDNVSAAEKVCIATDDGIEPSVDRGEIQIYASKDKDKKCYIHMKNTGVIEMSGGADEIISVDGGTVTITADKVVIEADEIEIGGNADYAVRFNILKQEFDKLKSHLNIFITSVYNLHMHPTAALGSPSLPTLTDSATVADISGAKVDSVKLP